MSKVPIFDLHGGEAGAYEIADDLLVLKRGAQAVHDAVVAFRAGLRAGTASTLTKGTVAGSNLKPWRQKGLGRARAGYRQSPIWRGGGVAFGPHPRSYAKKMPKQMATLAFGRVFSEAITAGRIKVLNELSLPEGKTKKVVEILKELKIQGRALIVLEKQDENLKRATRNLDGVAVALASDLNIYQMLYYPIMLVTKNAMPILTGRLEKATIAEK